MHILVHIYVSYVILNNILHIFIEYPAAPRKLINGCYLINFARP
jgi:hypothetical protein